MTKKRKYFSEKSKHEIVFEHAQWELLKALRGLKAASALMPVKALNVYDVIEDNLNKVFHCNISLI